MRKLAPSVILEVPEADAEELFALFGGEYPIGISRGFDGTTYAQALIILNITSYRLLRTWLLSRAEQRKNIKVVWNGREFTGLKEHEIANLLKQFRDQVDEPRDPNQN